MNCPRCGSHVALSGAGVAGGASACPACGVDLRVAGRNAETVAGDAAAAAAVAASPLPAFPARDTPAPPAAPEPETAVTRPVPREAQETICVPAEPETAVTHPVARPGVEAGSEVDDASPGTPFGRYHLIHPLGAGGMGVVYKAWDTQLKRVVALKQIKHEQVDGADALNRFLREARLAAKLRHPNIVAVHDVGVADGRHYITMDYVQGRSLDGYLAETREAKRKNSRRGADRLRDEVGLLADIAGAVAYAHTEGIVHRDLKPSNVLLDAKGRVYVMDFGLAKEVAADTRSTPAPVEAPMTRTGVALGTPAYMSPEQSDGYPERVGPRSDVWALGVMLYEILTGSLPFEGASDFQILSASLLMDPAPPKVKFRFVPDELETVCFKALEKIPERRYADAGEFAEDLRRWLRGEPIEARRPTLTYRAWRWALRRKALVVQGAVALVVVAAVLAYARWERERRQTGIRAIVDEVATAVGQLEDTVMKTELAPEARRLLAKQPLALLDRVVADNPGLGPACSWRGKLRELLGNDAEARADYDRGCALSPESAVVWYLRGMSRIGRYARSRGVPRPRHLGARVDFVPPAPETDEERALREGGLADFDRMAAIGTGDRLCGDAELRLGRAMAALHSGRPQGYAEALALVAGVASPPARKLRGCALLYLLRFAEAVAALSETVAEWPQDDDAWCTRAAALYDLGLQKSLHGEGGTDEVRRAIADLGEALKRGPRNAGAYESRALAWRTVAEAEAGQGLDAGESFRRAIADCDVALKLRPGSAEILNNRANAWQGLAVAGADRGKDPREGFRRAIADLTEALRRWPDFAEALDNRSIAWHALGAAEAARGGDPRASYAKALADCDEAVRVRPDFAEAFLARGNVGEAIGKAEAERGGDPTAALVRAIVDFDTALRLRPELTEAFNNRGNACHSLAEAETAQGKDARVRYAAAIADYTESLRRNPGLLAALANRSNCERDLGDAEAGLGQDPTASYTKAAEDADAAVRGNPGDPMSYNIRGLAHWRLGEVEARGGQDPRATLRQAVADLAEALRRNPAYPEALNNRGNAYNALGQAEAGRGDDPAASFAAAIADLTELLRLNPEDGAAYNNRGSVYLSTAKAQNERGQDPRPTCARAEADFRSAIAKHCPTAWLNLGSVLRAVGRFEEAIAAFEAGAKAVPVHAAVARAEIEAIRKQMAAQPGGGKAQPPVRPPVQPAARPWAEDLAAADRAMQANDYAAARDAYEKAFAGFEQELAALPEAERGKRLADGQVRAVLAGAHYNCACAEAVVATGRGGPAAPAAAVDEATARAHRDRAFAELEAAIRFGFQDLEHLRADEDLASLRADPRFAALAREHR